MELFQRVERERQRSSVAVRNEIDKYLSEAIVKSVLLLGILVFTLSASMTVDILISVQGVVEGFSAFWLVDMFLVSFFGMIFDVALFAVYHRHYHSKNVKTNVVYSTIFAATITLTSSFVFYQVPLFSEGTL